MKDKISRLFAKKIEQKKFSYSFIQNANASWIVEHSKINCLKLNICIPYQQIEKEIKTIPPELFVSHRDESYEDNRGWRSFVLHGKSYDASREDTYYNDNRIMHWTDHAKKYCPNTVKYFKTQWPCNEFYRVRVMLLEPGGIINLHKDMSPNGNLTAVNIAITQPKDCKFYLDNYGVVPFEPGLAFLLDVSNYHTVINDSDENRYHIIVHHKKITTEFDSVIEKSYNSLYAS